ncbi:ankyrin repeat domain-containing protein 54-like isoform X2 [Belonocnema kinseyi]|uniref:ankyrin repeat domain-containing protein 54-like isoform X2 n=1 Tax=Belonocnema kinseyi TaxID=2817044 RepID=UPI00143DE78D|nr:ankyrin repeat domain-containing protein 54-like isoform X2 [Belonocnema kinseyi]
MTSVDSGVETGNDSNDSLVAQHENIPAGQASGSTSTFMSTSGSQMEGEENENDTISIKVPVSKPLLLPIASICPGLENCNTSTNSGPHNFGAGTSGPLALCPSSVQVLQFRIPPMYSNGQFLSTMEILKSRTCFKPKMKCNHIVRRPQRCITWKEFQGPLNERKMRLAAATNNIEMMRRLLNSGVSPNNKDEQGRSPLHLASCRGYAEMVRLLLEHGADPNQRDCIGNTPLHLAAVTSKISVVTLLLMAGTDVLSSDQHGHNPLQIAQTKLRLLQNYIGSDMIKVKEEVHNIVAMLLAYLEKQKNVQEQVESLSSFCSRLSLSNTSDQIQDDVRDLLANLDSLSLTS